MVAKSWSKRQAGVVLFIVYWLPSYTYLGLVTLHDRALPTSFSVCDSLIFVCAFRRRFSKHRTCWT